jgi:hypothetical protein
MKKPGVVLFDIMSHTLLASRSSVGNHQHCSINTFLQQHVCGSMCKKLRLEDIRTYPVCEEDGTQEGTEDEGGSDNNKDQLAGEQEEEQ